MEELDHDRGEPLLNSEGVDTNIRCRFFLRLGLQSVNYSLTFTYIGLPTQVEPIEKFTLAFNPQFYLQKMRLYNIQPQNLQK